MNFMVIPTGLTDEQEHIYIKLYKKCDPKAMAVEYSVEQLIADSNKCFNLNEKKIKDILKFFKKNNYIIVLKQGRRGNQTVFYLPPCESWKRNIKKTRRNYE